MSIREEKRFYKHLKYVSERIQKEPFRHVLRWFLEKEGFSRWEINAIERPIDFRERKLQNISKRKKK